ncbi:MAG: endonuclease/exonuclease/phosphatase family protein, partial [Bradymonadaceae bacterium]
EDHTGPEALDTADFDDEDVGNLRVDYALPASRLEVVDAGVFWPRSTDSELARLSSASDHRLVWVDIRIDSI